MHVLLLPLHLQETKILPRQRHKTFVLENKIRAGASLMVFQNYPLPRKFMIPDTPRSRHTARNYPLWERTEIGSPRHGHHGRRAGEGINSNFPVAGPGFGISCFYTVSMLITISQVSSSNVSSTVSPSKCPNIVAHDNLHTILFSAKQIVQGVTDFLYLAPTNSKVDT